MFPSRRLRLGAPGGGRGGPNGGGDGGGDGGKGGYVPGMGGRGVRGGRGGGPGDGGGEGGMGGGEGDGGGGGAWSVSANSSVTVEPTPKPCVANCVANSPSATALFQLFNVNSTSAVPRRAQTNHQRRRPRHLARVSAAGPAREQRTSFRRVDNEVPYAPACGSGFPRRFGNMHHVRGEPHGADAQRLEDGLHANTCSGRVERSGNERPHQG